MHPLVKERFLSLNDQVTGQVHPQIKPIGTTNLSFNNIRQLVIANKDFISLGELGHLLKVGYNTTYSYTLDASYATSTNYVDNAKMNLFGGTFTTIPDYFTVIDPKTIPLMMTEMGL